MHTDTIHLIPAAPGVQHRLQVLRFGPAGAARVRLAPARLAGHGARWVAGECFPMIRAEDGAAEGLDAALDLGDHGLFWRRHGLFLLENTQSMG
jgi:hypothetical protein